MGFMELLKNRRSIRTYTGEAISEEKLNQIVEAGLLSFSGKAIRPWEFIVVRDKAMLEAMSECRDGGAGMLKGADAAIVVLADTTKSDVWTEDTSVAMTLMHLMASKLGVGSCWIQGRLRKKGEEMAEDILRGLLNYPEEYALAAILSLGMPVDQPEPRTVTEELKAKVHFEKF